MMKIAIVAPAPQQFYTLGEVAKLLRKPPGWLSDWLRYHPADRYEDACLIGSERTPALQHQSHTFERKTPFCEEIMRLHRNIHDMLAQRTALRRRCSGADGIGISCYGLVIAQHLRRARSLRLPPFVWRRECQLNS